MVACKLTHQSSGSFIFTATIFIIVLILICFGFSFLFTMRAKPPPLSLQSQQSINTCLLIPIISGVSVSLYPKRVSFNDIMCEFFKMSSSLISSISLFKFPIFKWSILTLPGMSWNRFDGICGKIFSLGFSSLFLHVLTYGFDFMCSWLCVICQVFWLYWRLHILLQVWTCLLQVSYLWQFQVV